MSTTTHTSFKPFIPDDQLLPEFTLRAVFLGGLLGIVFGASSVYLALKAGQTVSASIPCAVIATLLFHPKKRSAGAASPILECNIVQTIGSAGESIAAGVVFTVPALIFLGFNMEILHTLLLALTGGFLGVLMMIPLRRYLIVKEHGALTYPEGTACAEILMASEQGGGQAKRVFGGMVVGAVYKFLMVGLRFWQDLPTWQPKWYPGSTLTAEVSPELLGVGYIIGYRTSAFMVAGGVLSWLILIPIFRFLGAGLSAPLYPAGALIRDMSNEEIYGSYIRYIGAGAVATGGLINLFRSLPSIWTSFHTSARQLLDRASPAGLSLRRTERDIPMTVVIGGSLGLALLIWLLPVFHVNFLSAVLIVIFGFFFSVVSSRLTGQVGSSSCPNSGMAIATLIGTCLIFLLIGWSGHAYSA
ncbi:MAG: oligopeptide transporter, OPT family, partial [Acidobacteria bacterium]|nr:oligopeptide transporter, OPT family [Acidobacteriota bacterium]